MLQRKSESSGGFHDERGAVDEKSGFEVDSPERRMQKNGEIKYDRVREDNQNEEYRVRNEEGLHRMGIMPGLRKRR